MASRSLDETVEITLGPMAARAEARMASGDYESISDLLREGVLALDREEAAMLELVKKRLAQIDADPRPAVPMEEAFARLDAHIAKRKVELGVQT